jgi:hypothetical protein
VSRCEIGSAHLEGSEQKCLFRLQIASTSPSDRILILHTAPGEPRWRVARAAKPPHLSSVPRDLGNWASAGLGQLSNAKHATSLNADNPERFTRSGGERH